VALDDRRTYAAATVVLELDGEYAATLFEVEGGQAFADVVADPPSGGANKKHLGPVRYAPVTISFGGGLAGPLLRWVTAALAGEQPQRDGAVVLLDHLFNESFRIEFVGARISDIELPRFDGSARDLTTWTVVFQPTTTSVSFRSAGRFYREATGRRAERWLAANFRLSISGLEAAGARVATVEPIIVHQEEDGSLSVSNLLITVANAALPAFVEWHDDFVVQGNNGDDRERTGTLVQLAATMKDDLFTIGLQNIGIVRISPARVDSASRVVAKSTIELYVEAVELTKVSLAPPAPAAPNPAPPPPATEPVGAPAPGRRQPTSVAERLLETRNIRRLREVEPTARLEGMDAGERWAATTASLGELESLVAPGNGDWTALRLTGDHSLADFLRTTGVLEGESGPVDLSRDAFVDGLVAGAERVFRDAQPHLGSAGEVPEGVPGDHISGSSGRTNMKVSFDDDNNLVVIETTQGTTLTLSEDATTFSLRDQNGNLVELGDDGITIQSARNLTLKAAGTVQVSGANVDLRAQTNLKADASMVDLHAGGPMTIKGAVVRIN